MILLSKTFPHCRARKPSALRRASRRHTRHPLSGNHDACGPAQLRRWNITESALPGGVVLYREPTLWERDGNYIIATILVILALSFLIAALLWQRVRKRKTKAVMHGSEKRFEVMAIHSIVALMCNKDGKITYLNRRRMEFTGSDPEAG
jgi:hypothetical protein